MSPIGIIHTSKQYCHLSPNTECPELCWIIFLVGGTLRSLSFPLPLLQNLEKLKICIQGTCESIDMQMSVIWNETGRCFGVYCITSEAVIRIRSHTFFYNFKLVNILFSNSVYETIVRKYSAGLIWNRESGTREGSVSISVNIAMYVEYRH